MASPRRRQPEPYSLLGAVAPVESERLQLERLRNPALAGWNRACTGVVGVATVENMNRIFTTAPGMSPGIDGIDQVTASECGTSKPYSSLP
jgi:hypothetical protein